MSTTVLLIGCATLSVVLIKICQKKRSQGSSRLPPGPPGRFLIGNLGDVATDYAWLTWTEWRRIYGPINYLNAAGQSILIANSQEVATSLLDERSAIYSDRPRFVMAAEVSGYGYMSVIQRCSPLHKTYRKLYAQALHPRVVQADFAPLQERLARSLVKALLDDADQYVHHFHRFTGEVMQSITYGCSSDGDTDFVQLGADSLKGFQQTFAGYCVDFVPWLKYLPEWFPGAQFKRDGRAFSKLAHAGRWLPFYTVKKQAADGTAPRSFVSSLLQASEEDGGQEYSDDIISSAAALLFAGGSGTTAGTFRTFLLAMTLYPDIQAKARQELDRVVGDCLPTLLDMNSTPYLNALIKETVRWHPSSPMGAPHRLMRDDSYDGFFIPEGTIVLVNVWGIMHDERHFPDPFAFKPERFLPDNQVNGDASPLDPWSVAFGYGTRSCQGTAVAQSEFWIGMAMILYALDIRQRVDPRTMQNIVPEASWTGGSDSVPKPFVCDIVPRSPERIEQIRKAIDDDGKSQH